jgi:ribosomal protein S12 methylthiotransferase
VNSCGFIEAAKRESINAVLAWKKRYPQKKILLSGCLTQRYRAELEESLTEADGFLGCDELKRAAEKAAELFDASGNSVTPDSSAGQAAAGMRANLTAPGARPLLGFSGSAYVKISEGCNNNCSFCAIPLIRGPLRCRPVSGIVKECKSLIKRGVKELCLIGQDLASYTSLVSLLEAIAALPGNFWVRLLYLHPDHFPQDILNVISADSRFLPYFDIPFQHASSRILSLMGRNGDKQKYLGLLRAIRLRLPDAVIRSTFLVGFPGETEEDFSELLDFQKRARFDWLGIFSWSREEGTTAYSMKGKVGKKTAAAHKALVEERQIPITEERMNRFVGRTMDALVEEKAGDGLWLGRLFCQAPEVDGAAIIRQGAATLTHLAPGTMIQGTITARSGFDLEVLYDK